MRYSTSGTPRLTPWACTARPVQAYSDQPQLPPGAPLPANGEAPAGGWHRSPPLSGDTAKPDHGATISAMSRERKPPDSLGAGTRTPERGGPHGQPKKGQ